MMITELQKSRPGCCGNKACTVYRLVVNSVRMALKLATF